MNIDDQMSGIYAVVLAVKDLDSACKQYAALGFRMQERERRAAWGIEAAKFDSGNGSMIELLTPAQPGNKVSDAVQRFLDKNGDGIYQIAIRVRDIDAVNAHLKGQENVKVVAEPHALPSAPQVKVMWISPRSTHGIFLEFIVGR
jgi:methylmalonyl-CoA/ethylmalonyl-CoA epimerase